MAHRENHGESCSRCAVELLEERSPLWRQQSMATIAVSAILLLGGLYTEFVLKQGYAVAFYLAVVAISGRDIVRHGISSLFQGRMDMNFLILLAAAGAFAIGHGEEGAAVVFLFYIAESLEEYAGWRAQKSIGELVKLAPETACVLRDEGEEIVHIHDVEVGDIVAVRPGEKIPVDGTVTQGSSNVNQAPITGESMPVAKKPGDRVYAGTLNENGYLEIKTEKKPGETIISKIVKLVEEAERKKSPTEKFVDRFARTYTPTVIILAAVVATIPPLLFNLPFEEWLYKALVLLVVSCPCALAISTPVSMVSSITSAARNGVLIKGGSHLEELNKSRVFVFDKTGTLTEGKPRVVDVITLNTHTTSEVLETAASLEAQSEHPIAKAILEKNGARIRPVHNFQAIPGKGIKGEIDRQTCYLGSPGLFQELGIPYPAGRIKELEEEGKTAILLSRERECLGIITIMDTIRDTAPPTLAELKKLGVKLVMLTGDNERIARAIATSLTISEYHSGLLPEDKVAKIEELNRSYGKIVMIGDGINDAPALAKANIGIAMGAIGSDIALETADITLIHDDLTRLTYLHRLSRKTMKIIKENITASILIKTSFALLTFPGLITLWLAVAAGDMGLSLLVILNSMRLSKIK